MFAVRDRKLVLEQGTSGVVDYFTADLLSFSDYFPYGMVMPGRNGSEADYRYGFNGMEADDEIKGTKNSYDFGARLLDPRVGRWLSIDHLAAKYPDLTPYNFVANSPLVFVDKDGNEISFAGLSEEQVTEIKATIEVLKKSEIFAQLYTELENSSTVVSFQRFKTDGSSSNLSERASGFMKKTEEGITVGWGDKLETTIAQELFHAYQGIAENEHLYQDATLTDKEVEGEVATFYIAEEINPAGRDYFPMGGTSFDFENVDPETNRPAFVVEDIFTYSPRPSSEEANSEEFDSRYQSYKSVMVQKKTEENNSPIFPG